MGCHRQTTLYITNHLMGSFLFFFLFLVFISWGLFFLIPIHISFYGMESII
jgi:hypothetical protein